MDLYLVPNDAECTMLVSASGVAHYQIDTPPSSCGTRVTSIHRLSSLDKGDLIAEIEWKGWGSPTYIRSSLIKSHDSGRQKIGSKGVRAIHFLYKRHRFSPSRYFVGEDTTEYRWQALKGLGCVTNTEIARILKVKNEEGFFAGEKRFVLRVQPSALDIDLIVLTFIFMEKKRRERDGFFEEECNHDEDAQGDGAMSGDGDAGPTGEL